MNARLLLVRHGESTWNAEGRWQGQADPPLSELGARQASAAAAAIHERVDGVWSSDLERSARSARILAAALGVDAPRTDVRLRERDAGAWTGCTRGEIEERWPGDLAARRSPPGFERDELVTERALAALLDCAHAVPGGTALVVTHGGVIRVVERHLGAEPEPIANLGARWVVVDGAGITLGARELLVDPDDIEVTVPPPR